MMPGWVIDQYIALGIIIVIFGIWISEIAKEIKGYLHKRKVKGKQVK